MNRAIRFLGIGCLVLFLALLGNATYLQYWAADDLGSLAKHADNTRVRNALFSQHRGTIGVAGMAIAESRKSDDKFEYQRVYPRAFSYAHITGFFSRDYGVGGIEASQNDVLSGEDPKLFVNRVVDLFQNRAPQGGTAILTVNPDAQKAAFEGLRALGTNTRGAVVALEPDTGRILAMVSSPTFNPNQLASHDFGLVQRTYSRLIASDLDPLNNRAIEETLPPGSTFKLVTAAAALESGKYREDTPVPGGSRLDLPLTTTDLRNENNSSCGGNRISLKRALEVSCNVAFGSIGLKLGGDALREQARKFGFETAPFDQLDDPLTRMAASRFQAPSGDGSDTEIDAPSAALSAIGQSNVAATPLQMAMVTATIANGGTLMAPYLVEQIQSSDLEVLEQAEPKVLNRRAISASTARALTDMMVGVVDNGTGSSARIPGIAVAGKTGTAQSAPNRPPYAWFVSFAPATGTPKVAVAVLVQDAGVARDAISGNGLAAPIATDVMRAVLGR